MNRKKTVKKSYFSFLPTLADSRVVRNGLFLTAGLVIIFLCWLVFSSGDAEASTVFGVLALFAMPLIILATIILGVQKLTGISCLRGVEWVGKYTLLGFDWIVIGVQRLLGFEHIKPSQSVAQAHEKKHSTIQSSETLMNPILKTKQKVEPELTDFTEQKESEFSVLDLKTTLTETPSKKPNEESIVDFLAPSSLADDEDEVITDSDDLSLDESHSEIISTAINSTDNLEELSEDYSLNNVKVELLDNYQDTLEESHPEIVTPAINSTEEIEELVKEYSFNNAGIDLPENRLEISEEEQDFVPPLSLADDTHKDIEVSVKPDFPPSEKNDITAKFENSTGVEEPIKAGVSNESGESEGQLNSSMKALLEEAESNVLDLESFVNDSEFTSEPLEIDKNDVEQLIQSINSIEDSKTEMAEPKLQLSMLAKAEEGVSSTFSSFSEKFSRASTKLSDSLRFQQVSDYQLPAINLLQVSPGAVAGYSKAELEKMSRTVERVLKDYKVIAEVVGADPGPIITRFELLLAPGVKVSRVSSLAKDLARAMLVTSVRVVEIIEGTPFIGLEIPNNERELVSFREIIASDKFQQAVSPISLALGKDVSGQTVVFDLAKMPHLLVAGTTGSGKSVAINTMILSMLYKATPEQVRMIMIDPKMLELSIYADIPHLLTPVVTDMKEAQNALRWAVAEMERRYKLMSKVGVRNLAGFNQKIEEAAAKGETIRDPLYTLIDPLEDGEAFPVLSALPSIVIVIDELADMMMIVGKKVEELIARLAQKARAAGIHLVLATQRPSVDVLTGLIKANVPTRISFQVSSRIDSRTILDQGGAEALLGNGDMLFLPSGTSVPLRAHGAFVGDDEVHAVVDYLKTQGVPDYLTTITQDETAAQPANSNAMQDDLDALYDDAVSFVRETGKASISSVQRRFKIGYNRAARIIDRMEHESIISEAEGNSSRRVLNREE